MIQAHGNGLNPEVFLISDHAIGDDISKNYAISGYQHNVFEKYFKSANFNINQVWKTLLIKDHLECYDQKPKGKEAKIKKQLEISNAIMEYSPILLDEINTLKPNLLIPTGELSFNFLTGLNGIRKFRGSVLPCTLTGLNKATKVLPILGPYPYLNQDYKMRFITALDCRKISRFMGEEPIPDNFYAIWIAENAHALRTYFERHYENTLKNNSYLVFDIETFAGIPTCMSFCFDGKESCCAPLLDPAIDRANRALMFDLIGNLLKSPIRKVNQNIKYDWKRLEAWGFRISNVCGDTMLAASTLYCEFPKNLGFLTSIYTDLPYFKDEGREFDPNKHKKEQYYLYNAKDSLATHQIYNQQQSEIVEKEVVEVYKNLISVMPIYRRCEDRGLRVDEASKIKLLDKYNSLFEIKEMELFNQVKGEGFAEVNSLSPVQMRNVVYGLLGYKPVRGVKYSESGEPSTDEDSLELLLAFGEASRAPSTGPYVLECIIACRKFHKVIEILNLPLFPDGRFRIEFNLAGTENGRTTSSETTDRLVYTEDNKIKTTNLGHSIQNIGKHGFSVDGETYGRDIRSMFKPSRGFRFIEGDGSQAEARVDAILSGSTDLSYFDPPGIHRITGCWLFDEKDPWNIKKDVLVNGVDRYYVSKTARHAGERNIGPDRLATMLRKSRKECIDILVKFHAFQPEIQGTFHKEVKDCIQKYPHELRAPNGRFRAFYDRLDSHGVINEAISYLPQAIVSDQTKFHGIMKTYSISGIYDWAALLAEAHDGILNEVKISRESDFANIYKNNFETPIDFNKCSLSRDYQLIIPCEFAIGEDWNEMEKFEL
jgi:hypothetical protein